MSETENFNNVGHFTGTKLGFSSSTVMHILRNSRTFVIMIHIYYKLPSIAQLRGQYFQDYYLSVNDVFDNQHITTIVNFAVRTKRLVKLYYILSLVL